MLHVDKILNVSKHSGIPHGFSADNVGILGAAMS